MSVRLIPGDCIRAMRLMAALGIQVDSIVCDPPYHLTSIVKRFGAEGAAEVKPGKTGAYKRASAGFMGKHWDGGDIAFDPETWKLAMAVLKPGGYLLAFASSRGFGRMSVAIEDAGFITHPMIAWIFGSGFPKATRIKAEGYDGFRYGGQALKPAIEPIYMGQKPFEKGLSGTENILRHGTGAINVGACRIGTTKRVPGGISQQKPNANVYGKYGIETGDEDGHNPNVGRWPANVCHDGSEEVEAAFGAFGEKTAGGVVKGHEPSRTGDNGIYGQWGRIANKPHADSGSASRFFKSCKETDSEWLFHNANVNCAEHGSGPSSKVVASALNHVAARSMPGSVLTNTDLPALSMIDTASELRLICESVIAMMQSFASASLRGSPPERLSLMHSHAECVAVRKPTGIITITISRWKSNGSADPVTFSITETNEDHGVQDSRFHYSSKADALDRWGAKHPTVKPVNLMRWLVRLVTPPGGLVLDPFAGTGSTGVAALAEGMRAILIEADPEYQADIRARLAWLAGEGRHALVERARHAAAEKTGHGDLPLFANGDPKE